MEFAIDRYAYQARLAPVLVVCAPLALATAVWFPGQSDVVKLFGAILFSFGFTALLTQLGRDLGKNKEPELFRKWGGIPTTRLLSHRMSRLDALTLGRYHAKLQALVPEVVIPTARDEVQRPTAADQIYNSLVLFLREHTRDRAQFPLVFAENVNYGFRRNLWGAKPFGITAAAVGLVSCCSQIGRAAHLDRPISLLGVGGALICLTLLTLWMLMFTPRWVRRAAEAYAYRLLGSLDAMQAGG